MGTVELSDFSPYDKSRGGIQELHHKIESKTLQYWGWRYWYSDWHHSDI